MEIKLGTIGFCSGVERTVETAKETAAKNNYGGVYILKPLVHNKIVMAELKGCGISLKDLGSICCCDIVIIGAHGTSSSSYLTLKEKNAEGLGPKQIVGYFSNRTQGSIESKLLTEVGLL